ncbi:MAG TPA: alpha/beta hydrolase [Burkholderiales bacterium]|nr:alpha/beta hydrolase [Burkholderiales bacterium]
MTTDTEFRKRSVQCLSPAGLHRMAYLEWGDPRNPNVVVCVHGLTRSARDFDALARSLSRQYRVVCPDVVGRGDSDWLVDPMHYVLPQYLSDMVTLVARLDVAQVHWVGTSMGGLIGMLLAGLKASPVGRLVLNDTGPVVTRVSLERIATYVGVAPTLGSMEEAEAMVRAISQPFGAHSDAEWRAMTESFVRQEAGGRLRLHYDLRLGEPFRAHLPEKDLEFWEVYDAIRCPTLVIRGAESDLLSRTTCEQMTKRGPKAGVVEIPGVGHAPTLMHEDQIEIVRTFLLAEA